MGIHKTQDEENKKNHNTENLKDDQHRPHQKQRMNPDAGEW
jgi:hypothetical protein